MFIETGTLVVFAFYSKLSNGIYRILNIEILNSTLLQVYLPSFMFVIVSWVSFLVKPEVVPGRWQYWHPSQIMEITISRMAMLVTLFLVLINIFNSVRENAPISSRLNAVDLYLVVCIFFVFGKIITITIIIGIRTWCISKLLCWSMQPYYFCSRRGGSHSQKFKARRWWVNL